jgi:hypothetical protein
MIGEHRQVTGFYCLLLLLVFWVVSVTVFAVRFLVHVEVVGQFCFVFQAFFGSTKRVLAATL